MAEKVKKIALAVEFDGSDFHGWQRQQNALSVQEVLETAWFELTGENRVITGCSRTDTGVSARRHISHLITATRIPAERIFLALNTKLPEAISVLASRQVPDDFNARYSACGKTYSYNLLCAKSRPAINRRICAWLPEELDYELMRDSLRYFLGEFDFTALMDQGSPTKRPIRQIYQLDLKRRFRQSLSGTEYQLTVTGDGFLYHMVRILMGTIVEIGQGKIKASDIPGLLSAGNRVGMGMTMPAQGLILERVYYREPLFDDDQWLWDEGGKNAS
ncbi:MAG TPA: tRNA pseudouridine(38-40) synthase TruA [Clostridiaceae bacterium]|nr:tRNA pseudouridine(38-40) synthase TruA [Clostridiaceae bacterium]